MVAIGGAAGSLVRAEVANDLPTAMNGFPWATLLVNLAGCAVLGFAIVAALERGRPSRYLRPLVGTGFCGGMTTFSTFVVEVDLLVKAGRLPTATWYIAATMVGGLTVTRAAIVLARAVWKQEN